MKNRINLNLYNIRTDLVIDNEIAENYLKKKKINNNITLTTVNVNKTLEEKLQKKQGTYITLEFSDVTNHEDQKEIENCLKEEIKNLLKKLKIKPTDECLIIGLGNRGSTADSLGPSTLDKLLITRHLFLLNTNIKKGFRKVSAISPGVMANTGIETYDVITSLTTKIKPKFLIAIDSLASSSVTRINKTIQLTDTGIHPGSGIGNNRKEISFETIGIPVIAIGVPTVVESAIIVNDTIDYLFKHLSYLKNHLATNKLIVTHRNSQKYLHDLQNETLSNTEKKEVSGLLGTLNTTQKKELLSEVLNSIDYNLIVTPKEIDFLISKLSEVIANALNQSLHQEVNEEI